MSSADDAGQDTPTGGAEGLAAMHGRDALARLLGIVLTHVAPGEAEVEMVVTADHLNGQGGCHGGALFVLADTALGSASNSHGVDAVAATATIDFVAPVAIGSRVTARASETMRRGRTAFYDIAVRCDDEIVALFRGRTRVVG